MIKNTSDQINIIIPRGQVILEPIDLRTHDASDILIILEPSSSATIIHGSNPATCSVHPAVPGEASRVAWERSRRAIFRTIHCILHEHATLILDYNEEWQESIIAKTDILVEQKHLSSLYYTHSVRSDAQISQQFSLNATQPDTHADIQAIYQIAGKGSVTMTTLQDHDAKHTVSNLRIKGIVRDTAHIHHHGTIRITERGVHAESAQHTKLLLLSDHARAISVPNIEVLTHEVQCAHGSAIGRLDEEQLWYLQARGLSYVQAEQILIDGFLKF
jgi:Fe-S cluster assembly scaffold protein SufB